MNALSEILSHPFVHKLGWTLLHLLWQGAAVALLLGIVLCLLRKSSANVRYVVACSALALVVLAPAVTFCLISAPPASAGIESAPVALLAESLQERYTSDMPLIRAAEYMGMFTHTSWTQRVEDFCAPALPYIVAGWLLGVVGLSLYHLGGWTHLQRLRRRLTKQADASLLAKLGVLAEELRITRPVRLLESALVQIPTVVGWLRPVILLPATALTGLTSDQVEALLAHELAHIRRGDYLINMLQTVVEILGFYHPAVWWISNKIRLERENCCDDIAVAICGDKMHYATALAEMERIRSARGELALAANGGNLLTRIRRLIGKGPAPKSRFNWAAALVTAMVIAALAIPTTLALSRKYSSNAPLQPIVPATSETTDKLSAASVVDEAQGLAQITFVCKIFELPADLHALELEPGEETQEGLYVRTGNNYAQTLETLAEENKDVKVLASPKLMVLEGKQGIIKSESKMEYVKGYEEKPGNKSEPIKDTVPASMELKIEGKVAADNQVRTQLSFTQSTPRFETQNDAQGREVQIPQIAKIKCSTAVLAPDRQPFIVGGLKNTGDPQHKLMLMITPTVTQAEDTAEAASERTVDARTAPVVEKNDDDSGQITLEGDILVTIPQKGSNRQQYATLRASKLTLNLPQIDRLNTTSGIIVEGPAPLTVPIQDSQASETEEKAQILFELKYFALPANSRLIKEAGKDGTFVRTDKAFAEKLLELSKKSKEAKILMAPRIRVIEGEDAMFTVSSEIPYIAGYTEQPDGEPKPITRFVHQGFNAKVKGDLVGDNAVLVRLMFTQTVATLTTHKVAKGREIQIPVVRTTECATAVTVGDNGVVIIGGLQNPENPDQTFIVQMVSRIVRKGDTDSLTGPLPIADSSEEVSFTVAPQVITSVRVDTEGTMPALGSSGHTPAKAVEELIAMLKGQRSLSFELLDSKMAVVGQLDDLRKLVSEQSVQIDSVLADDNQALITTNSLKDDRGREGQLVFHLTRKDGKWTIDDIDFEDPQGLEDEMKRFDEQMRRSSESAPGRHGAPTVAGVIERILDFVNMSKGEVNSGVDLKMKKQLDELATILGGRELEIANARTLGRYAIAVSKPIEAEGDKGQLVFNLTKVDNKWVIDDIDFETPGGVRDEMARFNDRPLKAEPLSTRIGEVVEAPVSLDPKTTGASEKIAPRIFELQYGDPTEIANALANLLPSDFRKDTTIAVDSNNNRLIIMATDSDLPLIENLIASLDYAATEKTTPRARIYSLQHAKAVDVVMALENFVIGSEHKIVADEASNRLIVVADEPHHQQIERLIVQLDVVAPEEAEKPATCVFELRYTDPNDLANVLKSLLTQEEVRIIPGCPRPNHLMIRASESDLEQIRKLIGMLDVARAGTDTSAVETVTRVWRLKYADSQQAATMLKSLSVLGRNSSIVSDARLNYLIIQAPEADLEKIKDLIEELDSPVDEKAAKRQSRSKDQQLTALIKQREDLAEKMQSLREFISQEQRKLGITEFAKQQDLMLQRTVNLMNELAKTESLRMQFEAQLSLLEKGKDQLVSPQERLKMRQEYVNSDATVKALAEKIAQVEMELLLATQTKGGDHPEVKGKVELLKALKIRLVEAKDEVGRAFDRLMAVQAEKARQQNIAKARAEIEQNVAYEQKLRMRLDRENAETDKMAQKQLQIQGIRDELEAIKAMYDEANRRIMDLRMQPQTPSLPALYDIGEPTTE